jgi:hypothetical protein
MHAALQQHPGEKPPVAKSSGWVPPPGAILHAPALPAVCARPRRFHIQGITADGRTFRPSDWAERLAGAMASFRPRGSQGGIGAYIGYSPFCVPQSHGAMKCVLVSEELRDIEPMAWDFVMDFARDNGLRLVELAEAMTMAPTGTAQ